MPSGNSQDTPLANHLLCISQNELFEDKPVTGSRDWFSRRHIKRFIDHSIQGSQLFQMAER